MTARSCALGCGLWLLVMAVPALAFWLAVQRELSWTRGPGGLVQDRLFYIDEPRAGGLGYLAARVIQDQTATGGPLCVRTRVTYWLWRDVEGGDQNADFCQCYTRAAAAFQLTAAACPGE
jgi:hypothetical protein